MHGPTSSELLIGTELLHKEVNLFDGSRVYTMTLSKVLCMCLSLLPGE
jgi:hypothetical protein